MTLLQDIKGMLPGFGPIFEKIMIEREYEKHLTTDQLGRYGEILKYLLVESEKIACE